MRVRPHTTLDHDVFQRLLNWLDPDSITAAHVYETVRRKLIWYFEYRHCYHAESCADEVIDRVARKVASDEVIHTENKQAYFLGVARNVLREYWKNNSSLAVSVESTQSIRAFAFEPESFEQEQDAEAHRNARMACMRQCLRALPEDKKVLVTGYHQGGKRERIENRRRLASWLQMSENALRIRVHRIRDELRACVRQCLQKNRNIS